MTARARFRPASFAHRPRAGRRDRAGRAVRRLRGDQPGVRDAGQSRQHPVAVDVLLLLALPMTLIIMTEGLDLSIGAVLTLASIALAHDRG